MRCVGKGRWLLLAVVGLGPAACGDDGQSTESGAMDEGSAGGTAGEDTGTGTGTADGTADETGTEGGSDETGEDMGPWNSFDERPCPDDSFLTYENFGGPFMLSYCTGCHQSMLPADMRQGAPVEVNFDDIDDVRNQAERIWARGGDQNLSMPPVGPPDDEERALLGEWLACGSPTDADLGL